MNEETQVLIKKLKDIISPVVRTGRRVDYYAIVSAVMWELRDGAMDSNDGCISHAARQLNVKRTTFTEALKCGGYQKSESKLQE